MLYLAPIATTVLQVVRKNLNRPLTLAEKTVYGHLADPSQVRHRATVTLFAREQLTPGVAVHCPAIGTS